MSLVEVALQRCEGWRECRMPPLGDPCGLPWGFPALRGLEPGGPGRSLVPSDPCGVSTPFGWSSSGPRPDPKVGGRPSLRFRAPTKTCPCSPAPQRRAAGSRRNHGRPVPRCCLSWALVPYDTIPGQRMRLMLRRIPPPQRATSGVWLPPSRPPPLALPAREAPERPWALPSKAFPSYTSGAPFGVPAFLTLPAVL
jgi:hypothetical protein